MNIETEKKGIISTKKRTRSLPRANLLIVSRLFECFWVLLSIAIGVTHGEGRYKKAAIVENLQLLVSSRQSHKMKFAVVAILWLVVFLLNNQPYFL